MAEQMFIVPLATTVAWGTDREDWFKNCLDDKAMSQGRWEWLHENVEVTGYTTRPLGPILAFFAIVPKEAAALLQLWGVPNYYDDGRSEDWSKAYVIDLWKPKG